MPRLAARGPPVPVGRLPAFMSGRRYDDRCDQPQRGVANSNRPPLLLLVAEVRAVAELSAMLATTLALLRAPRGDGHSVIVIPGCLTGDLSTVPLRRYLAILNYNVHP